MRCRRHYYDVVSSYIGICASCLRERLTALIEAEAQMSFRTLPHHQKQSNPPPPPQLLFPRSVSPYTIKRHLENDDASPNHHHWGGKGIFSTPRFEITSTTKTTKIHTAAANKLFAITKLFKSKSAKFKTDGERQHHAAPRRSNSVSSPSWFTSLRRNSIFAKSTPDNQTPDKNRCIEVSPNRTSCDTPTGHQVKKKSISSASSRRVKSAANFTGLIFGLSPLAQPSPIRLRSNNSYSSECEYRVPVKPMMSTSSSLRGSRSRKLVESQSFIYLN